MDLQEVVRRHRMVRTFDSRPVPEPSLQRILHNATRAPSAGFSQGQAFLVLQNADLARFWPITTEPEEDASIRLASLVIVPCSSKKVYPDRYARSDNGWTDRDETRWPVPFWHIDTGMATLLILQTAVDEALGAPFKREFGVPADHEPIGAVAIGYDAETATRDLRSRRRPFDELMHFGQGRA